MQEKMQEKEFRIDRKRAKVNERRGYGAFSARVWPSGTNLHVKFSIFSDTVPSDFLSTCEEILIHKGYGKLWWNMANYFYDGYRDHPQHIAEYIVHIGGSEEALEVFDKLEFQ